MTYLLAFILSPLLLAGLYVLWARTRWGWAAAIVLILDVFVNFTWAWALWGRPERGEWTISKRLKRDQVRNNKAARSVRAFLNKHDPGHV